MRRSDLSTSLAEVLAESWRPESGSSSISPHVLTEVAPYLVDSGTGPLAWWRIRHTALRDSPSAAALQYSYREAAAFGLAREPTIEAIFGLLRAASIEPLLLKGWSIARLYPEPGLRPLGDIDLYVRPDEEQRVQAALRRPEGEPYEVDLMHDLPALMRGRSMTDMIARSELVRLGTSEIRVLCAEDQLAYLCIHFLKHGGWRPLWLCDVAIALEARPARFDWEICLGRHRTRADWIACTIGLAHALLGADVRGTPVEERATRLPSWLIPTVLKEWERPRASDRPVADLIVGVLRHPRQWPGAMRSRWMSPLESTVRVNGSFNRVPRLPYQVADYTLQLVGFLPRLTRVVRETGRRQDATEHRPGP